MNEITNEHNFTIQSGIEEAIPDEFELGGYVKDGSIREILLESLKRNQGLSFYKTKLMREVGQMLIDSANALDALASKQKAIMQRVDAAIEAEEDGNRNG